ncbi:carboxymuconolactone decarboxylase [Labilibaculum filiforme]|uniref:Carboxymuconolactone decarboxylase n=1 Tax=Labilibaculum filiforme TaxID=1940526 RepID=A0A2N3I3Z4_9BACT|nr:carboxymuconolactone decarboxylase family protein [Labilibaculum filiforme]PKQ65037.1 carboxymuconolactone decarboxylase [Labilibaculum filiforme]
MSIFKIHSVESAPEKSKPLLEKSVKAFGMVPGLHAVLAESPGLLEAYQMLHELFVNTSFNDEELTVVWQTINVEHECHYCVPAHTAIAKMMKIDDSIIEALSNGTAMPTKKLQALHVFTLAMVRNRGAVSEADINEFFAAGYEQRHVLEVILGLSQKVISNYTNRVAATPIDKGFEKYAWTKAKNNS